MKYSESLKKHKDFQHVYKKGSSYANKYLVMYVLENGTDQNRKVYCKKHKEPNLTQEQLAERLGVSNKTISK